MSRFTLLILGIFCFLGLDAQSQLPAFKPVAALQTWGVYTHGTAVYDPETGDYHSVSPQADFIIRRTRLGVQFDTEMGIKVRLVGAMDQVGHDPLAGTTGGTNNGSFPQVGLWDAYVDWRLLEESEALHLLVGYYTPMVSRESVVSAFDGSSMEKSFSQWYIRQHLTGRGPGRTTGLSLAGQIPVSDNAWQLKYGLGLHNGANTLPDQASALLSGRLLVMGGEAGQGAFRLSDPVNDFSLRDLWAVGVSGSWQGRGEMTRSSWSVGTDLYLRKGSLALEGEWYVLGRNSIETEVIQDYSSQAGFLRCSYTQPIGERHFLEPALMWMFFRGEREEAAQQDALAMGSFSGSEDCLDAGLNWYLNKRKLKVYLHYTWRYGNAGAFGPGAEVNMYFVQKEIGAIQRGNWLGLGLNVIL